MTDRGMLRQRMTERLPHSDDLDELFTLGRDRDRDRVFTDDIQIKRYRWNGHHLPHWWVSIGRGHAVQAYGWYADRDAEQGNFLSGFPGVLNDSQVIDPMERRDQSDIAIWNAEIVDGDDVETTKQQVREFSNAYRGNWTLTRNCMNFQRQLMRSVGIRRGKRIQYRSGKRTEYGQELQQREQNAGKAVPG